VEVDRRPAAVGLFKEGSELRVGRRVVPHDDTRHACANSAQVIDCALELANALFDVRKRQGSVGSEAVRVLAVKGTECVVCGLDGFDALQVRMAAVGLREDLHLHT